MALLGNFSQQIVLLDISNPQDMKVIARQATQYFEECIYRLRANTHHLWYPDNEAFIGPIGDNLYRFQIDKLKEPEKLGPHYLFNAHEIRWDPDRRYILVGDLGPENTDARQIAVFDLEEPDPNKRARLINLPGTVWHCCVHPKKAVGYALTYSFATEQEDYVDWAPAYTREYIFEVDLPTARITRVWGCGSEFPIHLNSDVGVTDDNYLYVASGGSHTVVEIGLDSFDENRVLNCKPSYWKRARLWRQRLKNLLGAMSRRPILINTHLTLQTLQVTGGRILDGIYAARVSPEGNYIVTANRGYNVVSVYDRKTFKKLYSKLLPFRKDRYYKSPHYRIGRRGFHLGFHHSEVTTR
jgi:DNA-binding beta-propeller fold protein YncE